MTCRHPALNFSSSAPLSSTGVSLMNVEPHAAWTRRAGLDPIGLITGDLGPVAGVHTPGEPDALPACRLHPRGRRYPRSLRHGRVTRPGSAATYAGSRRRHPRCGRCGIPYAYQQPGSAATSPARMGGSVQPRRGPHDMPARDGCWCAWPGRKSRYGCPIGCSAGLGAAARVGAWARQSARIRSSPHGRLTSHDCLA